MSKDRDSRYTEVDFVSQLFVHRFQLATREVLVMC